MKKKLIEKKEKNKRQDQRKRVYCIICIDHRGHFPRMVNTGGAYTLAVQLSLCPCRAPHTSA